MRFIRRQIPLIVILSPLVAAVLGVPPGMVHANAPSGRFHDRGDGTVEDTMTTLLWQQAVPSTTYSWANAKSYCAGLSLGSATGWRLPSMKELQTLVDETIPSPGPTIDKAAFPNTPAGFFWTSSPLAGSSSSDAWSVNFYDGNTTNNVMTSPSRVRCVR